MLDTNARRLTALAYFIFLGIGVAFGMAGVVTKAIAASFTVDTYVVGYVFTLFTVGYSLAIVGNALLLERVDIRRELLGAACLAFLGAAGATLWPDLRLVAASLFVYGLGMGVMCSIGYYLLINLYAETVRAAKLNVLNFFYSVGAIVAPFLAGLALQEGARWQWLYQASLLLTVAVIWWTLRLSFGLGPRQPAAKEAPMAWGPAVYVVGGTLLAYVVTEMVFTYWIAVYLMEKLAVDVMLAGLALSVFWGTMAAGRLTAGAFIARLGIRRYVLASAGLAFAAFCGLLAVRQAYAALLLVAVIGLSCSGLYATILSYGTTLVPGPSSRLTSFFLGISAGGGILAFLLSSWLKQSFDVWASMALAVLLMGVVTILAAAVVRDRRR